MSLSTQPYKGARDFYPEDKRVQDYIFNTLRKTVKHYGYSEYDAPIIEPMELYKAKTGDEIVNEQTYSFTDRGGREVTIRPEMTPTVSRMVAARRQELPYPLRWFSIPNLWRYERPQRGRLREHWQLNVDIFGDAGLSAEHEMITLTNAIFRAFGAKESMYQVRINSRMLVNAIMTEYLELDEDQSHQLIKLIDGMNKMEPAKVQSVLAEIVPKQTVEKINKILTIKSFDQLPESLKNHEATLKIRRLLEMCNETGASNAVFDITLMRGFDYYTDIVFEVFDLHPENNRSMFGGGRYDGLVGLFGVEPVPTVGFGMGDVTLANFLETHKLLPLLRTSTDILLVLIGDVYTQASKLAEDLREMELNVAIDATDRKLDKKLKHADKQGIRYVLFVGETELKEQRYAIKDLVTGKEEKHSAERIATMVKDYRNS